MDQNIGKINKNTGKIFKTIGNNSYYIDSNGGVMPLSKNYTERVPFVTGFVKKSNLDIVYKVADYVLKDEFLKH